MQMGNRASSNSLKLTPWYPSWIKPVREGRYEIKHPQLNGLYKNRLFAYYTHSNGWSSAVDIRFMTSFNNYNWSRFPYQDKEWRGICKN
jgi:hypothetical protein